MPFTPRKTPSRFALLVLGAALIVSLPLVLGFFGMLHPAFDSFAHFRAHLSVAMGLIGASLLFTALRREALLIVAFAVGAFATAARTMEAGFGEAAAPRGMTYTLMQFNMRYDNPRPEAFVRLLARENPDIVTLQEVSAQNRVWLERVRGTYAFQHYCEARSRIGGTAILSRRPWAKGSGQGCFADGYVAVAQIDLGGIPLDVASLHSLWPWPSGQPRQIGTFAAVARGLGETAILAGDFNAVPWSNAVHTIADAAGFAVRSPGPTWLAYEFPVALRAIGGLPIDNILTNGVTPVGGPKRAADGGSDHAPVMLRFTMPDAEAEPETQTTEDPQSA
jgi:endonuclease/exonuclease/phosphatase (EEP) superfamily protein YafD